MRELKFRVWNGYMTKEFKAYDRCYVKMEGAYLEINPYRYDNDYVIEQYTGLKDKSGKEIYEGDILQDVDGDTATVFWRSSQAEWGIRWTENKGEDSLSHRMFWDGLSNIVGNIHENPELLKGEE